MKQDERKALERSIWELEMNYGSWAVSELDPKWELGELELYRDVLICDQSTRGPKPWFGFPVEPPKPELAPVPPRTQDRSFDRPTSPRQPEALKIFTGE